MTCLSNLGLTLVNVLLFIQTLISLNPTQIKSYCTLTSPDQSSFLTLSTPVCRNDPLPITRTKYSLLNEFQSQISTTEHALSTEESDEIFKFVVEEGTEDLRTNQSIKSIKTGIKQSRNDLSLLSMNELHQLEQKPSSAPEIKLDQGN
ncbi:uncharacterized protein MELLADRAFT_105346 [Melampsora larici-populina 98AG31]|uniref:Secreted protein n=1 Tax=Melampsora larici-populina (strain 98AG31 / pathotype 3-4-7) TaxID=747676 RepID=F4RHU3_MELLP|nr:uncharacterized protein MELLADRAFT_105346 [Melampsora larici-populina 98AG31]EGG08076.1 hypothetical protein MELLADRAFT_105346 [Melampsora larici-populina 98AG31]